MPTPHRRKERKKDNWTADIGGALLLARRRLRQVRAWSAFAATLAIPLLLATAWVAATRYTLLPIPQWPALLIIMVWLLGFSLWVATRRITTAQVARYLDRTLELDERMSTLVEWRRRARLGDRRLGQSRFVDQLADDTSVTLRARLPLMPGPMYSRVKLGQSLALLAIVPMLLGVMIAPSPLDAVRAEQAALQRSVEAQLNKLAELRAEIVARPRLPDEAEGALLAELDSLERQLQVPNINREGLLATLADTQERIRDLSAAPSSATDIDALLSAGLRVQEAAAVTLLPELGEATFANDLLKSAEDAEDLSAAVDKLTQTERERAAVELEQGADGVRASDPELAKLLADAANALRDNRTSAAVAALKSAGERFRQTEADQQTAQAVESALARLDEGRQSIAQAGLPPAKRGQVGFRRREASKSGAAKGAQPNGEGQQPAGDGAQGSAQGGDNNPLGPGMGQSSPIFDSGSGSQSGGSGEPSGGAGGAQPGTQDSGQNVENGNGAGSNSGGGTGENGDFGGQISGPGGGANGPISKVENPSGRGVGGGASGGQDQGQGQGQGGGSGSEEVYVSLPGQGVAGGDPTVGQSSPQSPRDNGVEGRLSEGQGSGEQSAGNPGAGELSTIRTPYTQVIGQYAEQASQTIDRAYIPLDAKEYVKQYFTELGR